MDKSKNTLSKSKSSNGTTASRPRQKRNDKKSRSNAEIKPLALKKRGVYVEKKATKTSLNGPPDTVPNILKCNPCPEKKHFLSSVLNILSKTTAGTQFPGSNKTSFTIQADKTNESKNKIQNDYPEDNPTKKKQKYISRVLNKIENYKEDIVVLQSKKNMSASSYTINSYSEPDIETWSDFLPRLSQKADDLEDENMCRIAEHSESAATLVNDEQNCDDKRLYNFFVDLLETTFNVYNVKTALNAPALTSEKSSKVSLEIDEAVAKKLNVIKAKSKPSTALKENKCYFITPFNKGREGDLSNPNSNKSVVTINMSNRKRKLKPASFDLIKKNPKVTHKHTTETPYRYNKKLSKKDQKRNLINLLKEQLSTESKKHAEPQNFFQALKLMAKNKMRTEISTQVNESKKRENEGNDFQCRFKRRRLLSRTNKKSNVSPLNSRKPLKSYQEHAIVTR